MEEREGEKGIRSIDPRDLSTKEKELVFGVERYARMG